MKDRYDLAVSLLKNLKSDSVGVEVGVFTAQWSSRVLGGTNVGKIYQIDPYKNFPDKEYRDGVNYRSDLDSIFKTAQNNLSKYKGRYEFLRGTSDDFIQKFDDNSLEFVFIDGNHMFEYAKHDIELWYPKVKKGGLLIGDDFVDMILKQNQYGERFVLQAEEGLALVGKHKIEYIRSLENREEYKDLKTLGEFGVCSAVESFCIENNLKYSLPGFNQWVIYK
jgi:hypothetical protein